jgi:glutamate dehydrogenase
MLSRAALRDDLYDQEATLTAEVLREVPDEDLSAEERVDTWIESNQEPVDRVLQVLRDINSSGTFDLSTLSVALRETRNLANGPEAASVASEAGASSG